jgi:hypothetical protein
MNTIHQALADTKCAATSAVRAASNGRVCWILTSMILRKRLISKMTVFDMHCFMDNITG